MSALKRIKEYIDFKGINISTFEKSISMSNGSFSSQLKNNKTIGVDKLENILNAYPELNPNWILTGKGSMTLGYSVKESVVDQVNEPIPVYGMEASAGVVSIFTDHNNSIPMEHIRIPNLPKCDGAIRVTGDSMYPLLKSGDIVLFKTLNDKRNIVWGEMYLMYINNEGDEFFFVKYVQPSDREGYVKLVSQNQHHATVEFPIDSIQQIAIVKASVRINSEV